MLKRRSFGRWALVCATLLGVLAPGAASAYRYRCDVVWNEELLPAVNAVSEAQVLASMSRYKTMMRISEMGHKKPDLDHVKLRLREMSTAERKELSLLLAEIYNTVKAMKYHTDRSFKTYKRHLDVVLTELSEASGTFRYHYHRSGGRIEDALNAYFKKVQEIARSPVRMEADEVLFTALRLQDQFFANGELRGEGPIVLYGSFVNGRSFPKSSDLDFAVISPKLEDRMKSVDLMTELVEFPFSEAQPHTVSPRQVHELGYLNNIVILVKPKIIEIRVYHSHLSADFSRARSRFDSYYF